MRNKRLLRTLSALCLTLVLASGFTVPAFAQGAAPPPAEDTTNDSNVVVEETEKAPPLTPEGNAALVDDFGGNKQLITVTTKAGNYFYILIDRANEDKKTAVHFLNQVDEADLMALMEDGNAKEEPPAVCSCTKKCEAGAVNTACPVCVTDKSKCTGSGKVTGSVSKKTDYLINNDTESSSSKNKKAKELGIPILSEEDFLKLAESVQ